MPAKKRSFNGKLQTTIGKQMHRAVDKKWRKMGYFSESDYLRDLVRVDLKRKNN